MRTIVLAIFFLISFGNCFADELAKTDCDQKFDFAMFQIREEAWPKSTRIAYSKNGFAFFWEGEGNDRYKFQFWRISESEFLEMNRIVHCEPNFFDVKSPSRGKYTRPSLSVTAVYLKRDGGSAYRGTYGGSVYPAEINEVEVLHKKLVNIRDRVIGNWRYGQPDGDYGYGDEAMMEIPDPNYFMHFLRSLHR